MSCEAIKNNGKICTNKHNSIVDTDVISLKLCGIHYNKWKRLNERWKVLYTVKELKQKEGAALKIL